VALKKLLRYLSGTQAIGISLRKTTDFSITGYSDADWAGDISDRKSQTGFLIFIGGTLVVWASNKQTTISRSTTQAEYRAVGTTVEHMEAVKALLTELGVEVPLPMKVYCDNLSTTFIAQNLVCHTKMKHTTLDSHFIKERT